MGNIRVRKETGKLLLDFHYKGVRFREQTALRDNASNRKKVEKLLERVEAKIKFGEFDYADHFPGSSNIPKFLKLVGEPGVLRPDFGKSNLEQMPASSRLPDSPAFSDFARQWQQEKKVEWRASHARNVQSVLESSLIVFFGSTRVSEITKADILKFRTQLAAAPGRSQDGTMSPKTVNTHMAMLRNILEEASDRFDFENPYKAIKPLRLKRSHVEPFSLTEVNLIVDKVRADYRHYYTVRFYSGMRTGEIDGLKWEHVDFDRRIIAVRETLVSGQTEYTKTDDSQRDIPMLGPVFNALKEQYQATNKISPFVFCNAEGKPLDHNNVTTRVWYPLLRHLGLKKRRPYQTRHTAATLLLAAGENPEWVARFLGHSSTEMLFKVYSRYIPNLTRMDGSAFEHLLAQRFPTATIPNGQTDPDGSENTPPNNEENGHD